MFIFITRGGGVGAQQTMFWSAFTIIWFAYFYPKNWPSEEHGAASFGRCGLSVAVAKHLMSLRCAAYARAYARLRP